MVRAMVLHGWHPQPPVLPAGSLAGRAERARRKIFLGF